jgi:dTMP kinase
MNKTSNTDAVTDLHFSHGCSLRKIPEDKQKLCGEGAAKGKRFRQNIFGKRGKTSLHSLTTATETPQSKRLMELGTPSGASNTIMLVEPQDSGILIAFEGSDGSGKTTQRKLFKTWLQYMDQELVVTKWNSSPAYKHVIKAKKEARSLDPVDNALLHAADFRHRYENVIRPALRQGKTVLADRYIFTGLARDAARGLDRSWSMKLYSGVRRPDIVFYFAAPVEVFAQRILASREIKYYEAGQDVTGMTDPYQSYLKFAAKVLAQYEALNRQFGFVVIDAQQSIYEQHRIIRETYLERLAVVPRQPQFERQLTANFAST